MLEKNEHTIHDYVYVRVEIIKLYPDVIWKIEKQIAVDVSI